MKKILTLVLAASMLVCGGCKNTDNNTSDSDTLEKVTTSDSYPIKTDVTLRYWMSMHPHISASCTSFNDTEIKKYLEEATGIKLKFEHPVSGQETESFNILISSDDLPDIMEYSWSTYAGGPQKAIDEGVIANLNSYIDKVSPNLKKVLKENPDYENFIKTDDGNYFQYPFIRPNEIQASFRTYIIRKDLLDKAGLERPETLDELETALYKFKDMGIKSPLSLRMSQMASLSPLTSAFGFAGTFYHDKDGKVKYGLYEEAFGDYVKKLNQWYKEGILDKEFADEDENRRAAMVTNGENGVIDATIGGEFGNYIKSILPDSGIEYEGMKTPVKNKGDRPMWSQKDWPALDCAAISGTSKNKEIAARFLDFGYSKEGSLLYNFGVENESFTYQDSERGKHIPTYTALVTDSSKNGGLTLAQGISKYTRAALSGPFIADIEYVYQYYQTDEQKEALELTSSDTYDYKLPPLYYTNEEQKKYNDMMTPIETYQKETMMKLISGKMNINKLDEYYSELKRMGIEDVIKIVQSAYDRSKARAE